jgi:hypothetical protein
VSGASGASGVRALPPDPEQRATWVREHGAHLLDYAGSHLEPADALAAVTGVLATGRARAVSEAVAIRAQLLAVLRRDCFGYPGYRRERPPGSGTAAAPRPGLPDPALVERAWSLADPLGTDLLWLMYRYELAPDDLSFVLALPPAEIGRIARRTQDLVETLVSGFDALAHDRHACPAFGPLTAALGPEVGGAEPTGARTTAGGATTTGMSGTEGDRAAGERVPTPAEAARAREALITHLVECQVCRRPINIRYTVPQLIAHPPIPPLTPDVEARLLRTLVPPPVHARPSDGPTPTSSTPTSSTPTGSTPTGSAPMAGLPLAAPTLPAPTLQPPSTPAPPDSVPGGEAPRGSTAGVQAPPGSTSAAAAPPVATTPGATTPGAVAVPGAAALPLPRVPEGQGIVTGNLPPAPPAHDTPLYNALLSQAWAREVLARTEDPEVTARLRRPGGPGTQAGQVGQGGPVGFGAAAVVTPSAPGRESGYSGHSDGPGRLDPPGTPGRSGLGQAEGQTVPPERDTAPGPMVAALRTPADPLAAPVRPGEHPWGRILTGLEWVGAWLRSATKKIVIVVVMGSAGTLAGMNLLSPAAVEVSPSPGPRQSVAQAPAAADSAIDQDGLTGRLELPSVIELDEFGRGSLTLAVTGAALEWRISASGLVVSPSSGVLEPGDTAVISLRALRVRHWCGAPAPATAPLTLHGPEDSVVTTVRWRTC